MSAAEPKLCKRCKSNPATLTMRVEPVCQSCLVLYTAQRAGKRLGHIHKELRFASGDARGFHGKYLLGLSLGPSSAGLLHMIEKSSKERQKSFDMMVAHVDTSLDGPAPDGQQSPSEAMLDKYRARFPQFTFDNVPVTAVFDLDTVDWSALPPLNADLEPAARLRRLLEDLPSVTSRVDLMRLLVRHVLLDTAARKGCDALMLGFTTTAMAELTLAETAKGRGYAITCQLSDGPFPVTRFIRRAAGDGDTAGSTGDLEVVQSAFPVYFPMREILRRELVQYNAAPEVNMEGLVSTTGPSLGGSVVSHRELSIEDVMGRYFSEVEESYPSIVTNVVRTTEKLNKPAGDACGVCGMPLDGQGDARWKGELGEEPDEGTRHPSAAKLCYGCERSIRG